MRILLVVEETFFFHPKYVEGLCIKLGSDLVQVFLVTKAPKKNSLSHYLYKNLLKLHFSEIIILPLILVIKKIKDFFYIRFKIGFPQSVKSVLKKYNKKFIKIEDRFDEEKFIELINLNKIDLVLSSNPLYFNKKILNLQRVVFLNRHSSYLPQNAGIWPVFFSISKNHEFTGVTIHLMNEKIDSGKIIKQEKIKLFSKNLFDLYEVCFNKSVAISVDSIKEINKNIQCYNKDNHKIKNNILYNSFPIDNDWINFRNNGGRFVKLKNLYDVIFNNI